MLVLFGGLALKSAFTVDLVLLVARANFRSEWRREKKGSRAADLGAPIKRYHFLAHETSSYLARETLRDADEWEDAGHEAPIAEVVLQERE